MALSMEDVLERGFMEEKEKLVVQSRSKLKALCEELGITNERRVSSEFSAIITFLERYQKTGDADALLIAERLFSDWKADEAVTKI